VNIDLNFYPEQHMDELDDLRDIAPPKEWTVGQLVEALYDAKIMLWAELSYCDDEGNTHWR
jgi:hypothetical protein